MKTPLSWHRELSEAVRDVDDLDVALSLSSEEREACTRIESGLPLTVTRRFLSLVDDDDSRCPIRRQVIPSAAEVRGAHDLSDPLGETELEAVPHLVHRYPDRALLLVTDRCASYCRFCTRKRVVGQGPTPTTTDLERAYAYIAERPAIKEVILSGGDALILDDDKLAKVLARLRAVEHVELIRVATRTPIFIPSRVTDALISLLRANRPLCVLPHVNHARELSGAAGEALARLVDAGIPVYAQTVLLAGVNDDATVLEELFRALVRLGVKPYYLHQCDLAVETEGFRVPLARAQEIVGALRGRLSGIAMPSFVVDIPGGHGKVLAEKSAVVARDDDAVSLRGFRGGVGSYPHE